MSKNLALTVDAGATFNAVSIRYLEDDKVTPVVVTDITLQVRRSPDAELALEVFPAWDSQSGVIDIEFTAEQTSALADGSFVWAMECVLDNGDIVRLVEGKLYVSPEVVK